MILRLQRSLFPFLILAALAAVLHLLTRPDAEAKRGPAVTLEVARGLFPGATAIGPVSRGNPVRVVNAAQDELGFVLDTSAVAAANPGYGGPVPCVVGLSPEGLVTGVQILANRESPTFIEFVLEQGLLRTWDGLTAAAAAARPVDAISGATVTSLAISGSVQQTLAAQGSGAAQTPTATRAWRQALPWVVLVLALLSFLGGGRWAGLRLPLRLGSVIVLGFLTGTSLSLGLAGSWLAQGIPWGRFPFLATLVTAAVLVPILSGRSFYCAHICPFGCAQDLASLLWPWRTLRLSQRLARVLHVVRGAGLIALYGLLVGGAAIDLAATEPFAAFQWRSAPWPSLGLAGGFLLLAVLLPRAWCQHLCPTGYLLERGRGLPARSGAPAILTFERGALAAAVAAAVVLALRQTDAATAPRAAQGTAAEAAGLDLEPPRPRGVPDVLTAIHERRTVTRYSTEPVLPAQLDTLVRAAMAAPLSGPARPWAFVVVTEQKRLDGLAAALPDGRMLATAGAALIVCGLGGKALSGPAAPFWIQDCSAAAENALLAAQGLGLGAARVNVYPSTERLTAVRAVCAIPSEVQPLCVISLGQPAATEPAEETYHEENVHWERW